MLCNKCNELMKVDFRDSYNLQLHWECCNEACGHKQAETITRHRKVGKDFWLTEGQANQIDHINKYISETHKAASEYGLHKYDFGIISLRHVEGFRTDFVTVGVRLWYSACRELRKMLSEQRTLDEIRATLVKPCVSDFAVNQYFNQLNYDAGKQEEIQSYCALAGIEFDDLVARYNSTQIGYWVGDKKDKS